MINVIIMHQTVTSHDAIGNDIEAMYFLLKNNYKCSVYALNQFNKSLDYISEQELDNLILKKETVVIYHHSVYWEKGYEILKRVKGRIIFRYHNITPAEFFEQYNDFHYTQCKIGREQTQTYIKEFPEAFWISDSYYNAEDLQEVKENKLLVCPPFHKIEQWANSIPDEKILKELMENDEINLLFVGRVVPNKGHLMLLDILRVYCLNYSKKVKLRIIGKFDESLEKYTDLVKHCLNDYGVNGMVEFIGEINDSTLLAYYLGSDFLICTSEHEGFCVPIIEAQYFGLPVIALNECAVPETLGPRQIILEKNSAEFAAAIHVLYNNQKYQKFLQKQGRENYDKRFSNEIISKIFLKALQKGMEE